ncbi:hypothetical protein B1J93_05485 [Leptospira kirschneri serovar Pomona]|uniref:Uncharacterized protein n=1 Tax=Leptospira kirschneri serovar Pomona TaxID=561005 RepID=A0A1T1DVT2_9LEPT|nr:hypothetical protein LEP1GSC198_0088 [Leptospira kirschneri str. JB]EMK07715.1 hypothetical protein LEP1GSC166_2377 [Leptospira kirschneri]KXZ28974.1 hypothetical protein AYB32_11895 [Leptospira kirschneri]KXZ33664.1 hypothetical protein AYB34_11430 [Leptospira sp. ZV016]OOV44723.1 hypothetical protein B1J93_05485 [Leptospira kirschneri serovar Pomona]
MNNDRIHSSILISVSNFINLKEKGILLKPTEIQDLLRYYESKNCFKNILEFDILNKDKVF